MAIKVHQRISEQFSLSAFGSGSEADTTATVNADAVVAKVTIRPNVPQCRSSLVSSCSSFFTTPKTSFQFLFSSLPSLVQMSQISLFLLPFDAICNLSKHAQWSTGAQGATTTTTTRHNIVSCSSVHCSDSPQESIFLFCSLLPAAEMCLVEHCQRRRCHCPIQFD